MPIVPERSLLARLLEAPVRPGRVLWLGLRPARRAAMRVVGDAMLTTATGLDGDRYEGRSGNRQVTLIGAASLAAIAEHLGLDAVDPARMRRNVVTAGINLAALRGWRVSVGGAVLEVTGPCDPCSRMEEEFGAGGYNAVRGQGGVTARVVAAGRVAIGDPVIRLEPVPASPDRARSPPTG